jgi:hypothetical protein
LSSVSLFIAGSIHPHVLQKPHIDRCQRSHSRGTYTNTLIGTLNVHRASDASIGLSPRRGGTRTYKSTNERCYFIIDRRRREVLQFRVECVQAIRSTYLPVPPARLFTAASRSDLLNYSPTHSHPSFRCYFHPLSGEEPWPECLFR